MARKIKNIIIHCSVSDFGDAELIRSWHVDERGWRDIGYNGVILNGIDAAEAAAQAQAEVDSKDITLSLEKLTKAFALTTLDKINLLRSWIADFKAEVSAATSLADFQTRVNALPDTPDRSVNQLKTAVSNKYDTL